MKIAIMGGGFTGLAAAYYLAKKKNQVTVYEKENFLGGLASGFRDPKWEWYLEKTYHHLFHSENDIMKLAHEIGFDGVFFDEPTTSSLYETSAGKLDVFPLDTPFDLLRFPLLDLVDKIRVGTVLAGLKLSPFGSYYENQTSMEFLIKTMGAHAWSVLWEPMFRKKFGKYAVNILASFIWARINKRTKKLGYVSGGFQALVDYLANQVGLLGGEIKINKNIVQITKSKRGFLINNSFYNAVISTLPTPIITKVGGGALPDAYLNKLKRIQYLHAVTMIVETSEPLIKKTYWLSNCVDNLPMMVVVQHTNFIDKKHYNGNHVAYVANYVDDDSPLLKMEDSQIVDYYLPHLKKINPSFLLDKNKTRVFRSYFSQPVYNKMFLQSKPSFITPTKNFFIANLDMTYPCDRGVNNAIKLGAEVANICER